MNKLFKFSLLIFIFFTLSCSEHKEYYIIKQFTPFHSKNYELINLPFFNKNSLTLPQIILSYYQKGILKGYEVTNNYQFKNQLADSVFSKRLFYLDDPEIANSDTIKIPTSDFNYSIVQKVAKPIINYAIVLNIPTLNKEMIMFKYDECINLLKNDKINVWIDPLNNAKTETFDKKIQSSFLYHITLQDEKGVEHVVAEYTDSLLINTLGEIELLPLIKNDIALMKSQKIINLKPQNSLVKLNVLKSIDLLDRYNAPLMQSAKEYLRVLLLEAQYKNITLFYDKDLQKPIHPDSINSYIRAYTDSVLKMPMRGLEIRNISILQLNCSTDLINNKTSEIELSVDKVGVFTNPFNNPKLPFKSFFFIDYKQLKKISVHNPSFNSMNNFLFDKKYFIEYPLQKQQIFDIYQRKLDTSSAYYPLVESIVKKQLEGKY